MTAVYTPYTPIDPIKPDEMRSIAVFRALQLGDLLCTVPALRALRAATPQARITLIGLPWAADFAKRFEKYIDDFLSFPGFPGLPETLPNLAAIPEFFAAAHAKRFDLAIQMHGSGLLSNPITAALGARINAGFYLPGQYCPEGRHFASWSESEHEVLRFLRLFHLLGIHSQGKELEFPLHDSDYAALHAAVEDLPKPGSFVCIHPGARLPSRRWPTERFAAIADGLAAQGFHIIITGSTQERELTNAVKQAMQAPAIDMTGRTTLGVLAALIAQASLLVCNDTGVSHIAAAVATPSIVICCGADPGRWAPLNRRLHRVLHAEVRCRPCGHVVCPIGHPCAEDIEPNQVLDAAMQICAQARRDRKTAS